MDLALPGTLAIKTFSRVLDLSFSRIQFTPDLLPADLVGTLVFQPKTGEFTVTELSRRFAEDGAQVDRPLRA